MLLSSKQFKNSSVGKCVYHHLRINHGKLFWDQTNKTEYFLNPRTSRRYLMFNSCREPCQILPGQQTWKSSALSPYSNPCNNTTSLYTTTNLIKCSEFYLPQRLASTKSSEKYFTKGSSSSRSKLYFTLKDYIRSPENAEKFVSHLKENERLLLLAALETHHSINAENVEDGEITRRQLSLLFLHNCIPFIGFGFLDNAIMIFAGEYIDSTIGVTLGISTMAAAALGNLVSDLFGIGFSGYIEMLCYKLGLPVAALTPEQAEKISAIVSSNTGKAFGIIVGCILGMFPLLLLSKEKEESE